MKKLLYCVYGVFFTFIVWHVMYAAEGFDGAVKNSFSKGMDYPRQLAKIQELGLSFEGTPDQVTVGTPAALTLRITGRDDKPVTDAEVVMDVARPASRQSAVSAPVTEQGAGEYVRSLNVPAYGHWLVSVSITLDDEHFTHEFRIYAEKEETDET